MILSQNNSNYKPLYEHSHPYTCSDQSSKINIDISDIIIHSDSNGSGEYLGTIPGKCILFLNYMIQKFNPRLHVTPIRFGQLIFLEKSNQSRIICIGNLTFGK
jgi:hypothetical protein